MWKEVDEARYDDMLCVLPPALWLAKGFLVGEPFDHRPCTLRGGCYPTYAAFITMDGRFFEGPSLTAAEFRAVKVDDVVASSASS